MPDGLMKPDKTFKRQANVANRILLILVGCVAGVLMLGFFEDDNHLPPVQEVKEEEEVGGDVPSDAPVMNDVAAYRIMVAKADKESEAMANYDEYLCSSSRKFDFTLNKCKFARIERRASLTPEQLAYYFNIGRAVIVTNLTQGWDAFEKWTPARLKAKYGHLTVNVQAGRAAVRDYEVRQHLLRRDMNFGEFLDKVVKNEKENDLYLTGNNRFLQILGSAGMLDDVEPFYPGWTCEQWTTGASHCFGERTLRRRRCTRATRCSSPAGGGTPWTPSTPSPPPSGPLAGCLGTWA